MAASIPRAGAARPGLPLRTRIVIALTALTGLVILGFEAQHQVEARRRGVALLELRTRLHAGALAMALSGPIWDYDQDRARLALSGLLEDPDFASAAVEDDRGLPFADLARAGPAPAPEEAIVVASAVPYGAETGREGAIGRVAVTVSRVRLDRELRRDLVAAGARALVVLALVAAGVALAIRAFTRPLEVMASVIERRSRGDYAEDAPESYRARTDEVGAFARALQNDQQQRRDEARLLEVSSALMAELHLEELLADIVRAATALLGAERSTLFLYDAAEGVLYARVGEAIDGATVRVAPGEGLAGAAFTSREAVVVDDAYADPRFARRFDESSGFRTRSVLAMPVVARDGAPLGVLQVLNKREGTFGERDALRLRSLSAQAAIALENARLYGALEAERDQLARLNQAGARFVPFELLALLGRRSLLEVERGDCMGREMTILFSDIRGFTTVVEGLSPEESFRFINRYLSYMERPILEHGGAVEGYIGDAVMALFDRPDDALAAAIGDLRALARYNEERAAEGLPRIRSGIGLNTGFVMLGTIGGAERIKCGVIGDCVNLAARIESSTKLYGAALLLGEDAYERLTAPAAFAIRRVDRVIVKGRSRPCTLYEVLDGLPDDERAPKLASLERFRDGFDRYERGDAAGALACFEACALAAPGDLAAALYVERCRALLEQGVPPGWEGVWRLEAK